MKVVLSKKGVDSSNCNSPLILPNNGEVMTFFPISSLERCDFKICEKLSSKFNVELLSKKGNSKFYYYVSSNDLNKELKPAFHIDPQLENYFDKEYNDKFLANFGPKNNLKLEIGDIILFFGWYKGEDGKEKNVIFGYMQVGEIITLARDKNKVVKIYMGLEDNTLKKETTKNSLEDNFPFLNNQPHWIRFWSGESDSETIYIAKDKCDFNQNINGFGFLKYDDKLVLTKEKAKSKGEWKVERLKNIEITNYNKAKFDENGCADFVKNGFGQEFIMESTNAYNWAKGLIENNCKQ